MFTLITMYSTQEKLLAIDSNLTMIIYPIMLLTGALIAMYPIWPSNFSYNVKRAIILVWYPFSIFYMLIVFSGFFVLISQFSAPQTLLFVTNGLIATLLLGWRSLIAALFIGGYCAIALYQLYFEKITITYEIFAPESILVYMVLFMTTIIAFFLKPKQKYLETIEENLHVSRKDNRFLNNHLTRKNYMIDYLKDRIDHLEFQAEFRKSELNNALGIKTEFINNLAHESRLPISNISCLSELLLDHYEQITDQKRKETLKLIAQSSARLDSYVTNMIDLSKLLSENYQLNKHKINFAQFIEARLNLCQKLCLRSEEVANYDFHLELEKGVEANYDPYYLAHLFDNLIINAIKYSQGGKISLKLKQSKQSIHFSICDQGVGIPEDELLDIFGMFIVSSRTKSFAEGRGVGLTLCQKIISIFGGEISVRNNTERGVTFLVELPHDI